MRDRSVSSAHAHRNATHECPHPDCARQVPPLMWACFEHWQALPPVIRQYIWTAGRGPADLTLVLRTATERALAFWEIETPESPSAEQARRLG